LLSQEVVATAGSPKTLRFMGHIQGVAVVILVDSGSSHSFINASVAPLLKNVTHVASAIRVQVTNCQVICCTSEVKQATWSVQDQEFTSDFKVIPLPYYDMVLGNDWLEAHGPIKVDWLHKWMVITMNREQVHLCGLHHSLPAHSLVELYLMSDHQPDLKQSQLPPQVQQLLDEFSDLFEEPPSLPPSRSCDHTIPLIQGAQPVNIRPYRLSPTMKDEVEKQVQDMLNQGLIQHSSSAFSSPVLLVKKKDKSWQFCVDYRHLNALTVKSKYLVPIIDELLDEMYGATWFSSLELRAGFHQILLQPGEEHKTAFQTHMGHFEFRVMAFGLTGAPATFQKAMNNLGNPIEEMCSSFLRWHIGVQPIL
jgi:hypothetical protein